MTGNEPPRPSNRLGGELSPYLRQHAHNPVDWYPWGEEALSRARGEDRPILLSIGYSACHWCHVMERESFDDAATAALMNERFVNVKVDREERPDLDQIYQTTVQLMGRSGGWPLTVFLTPALEPFYAGTYYPPVDRQGMPSFRTILNAISEAWTSRRNEIESSADEITRAIREVTAKTADPSEPPVGLLALAVRKLSTRIDERHGGFGSAPKFPNTMCHDVLLRAHHATGDEDALRWVVGALDGMREGGIHDQLAGGFARYSTDQRWLVPHFEKMLYDNALLAMLYVDAFRATREARFADTARVTLDYLTREMRSPEGAFYSSTDADSEGEEGRFFVWTKEQIEAVVGAEDAEVACVYWGVAEGGNFEHGTTVLHVSRSPAVVARQLSRGEAEVREVIDRVRLTLREARERREHPFRDEKIIAAWNGLAISAFARAGSALDDARLSGIATEALAFLRERLFSNGRLGRIAMAGEARGDGFLEDYGDVACAAIDVYEATFDRDALAFASELVARALELFGDDPDGGFFFAEAGRADLVVRVRDAYDNAVPSGASAILHALLRLHALTGEARLEDRAARAVRAIAGPALAQPFGYGHTIGALDRYVRGSTTVILVGAADDPALLALAKTARAAFDPNLALARVDPGAEDAAAGPLALLGSKRMLGGAPTAYVCTGRVCGAPITDTRALEDALRPARP